MKATKEEIENAYEFFKAADTIMSMAKTNYYNKGIELVLKCLDTLEEY